MNAGTALGRAVESRRVRVAINFVAFQAAWFACVLAAAEDRPWLGIAAVVAALAMHVALSRARTGDLVLIVVSLGVGLAWEVALARTGLVEYAAPSSWPQWPPAWILALWALFASVLREPLRWLHGRHATSALFGAIGSVVSYLGAARLGACEFPDPAAALLALAAGWAVITPLLVELARRVDVERVLRPAARA